MLGAHREPVLLELACEPVWRQKEKPRQRGGAEGCDEEDQAIPPLRRVAAMSKPLTDSQSEIIHRAARPLPQAAQLAFQADVAAALSRCPGSVMVLFTERSARSSGGTSIRPT